MPKTVGYSRNSKISRKLSKKILERLNAANDKLHYAQQFRQKQRETPWRNSYDQYMNRIGWDNSGDPTADIVNVNISFSTINTILPFVADENPKFLVEPFSADATAENAELLQAFMNRLWESDKVRGQIHFRDFVFDYLLYGDGYMQIGYNIVEEPQYDAAGNTLEGRGTELAEFNVERLSPWDVWIDPYSDGIYNARWVCRRILVPVQELYSDNRYKIVDESALGGGVAMDTDLNPEDQERMDYFAQIGTDNQTGWVAIFEYYDIKERWSMTFTKGATLPIRYLEGVKCPVVQAANYRIPNSPYHIGELENILALQEELNKTRSQMITHRRRNVMKWMYRRDRVGEDALEGMQSEAINATIPIDGPDPFERLVLPIMPQPLGQDAYMMDGQIKTDINEITGVSDYLRGQPPDSNRSATEAAIIEGAANVRTRHKLLDVETAARQIGQMLLDIMSDVIPETDYDEMAQYITGRESERLNRALGAENIQTDNILTPVPEMFTGKYVVFVERGSTELRNPQIKAQKYKDVAQILINSAPLLQELGVFVNLKQALELWLKAEGISDVDALLTPDEEALMLQQQMQMMGMQQPGAEGNPGAGAPTSPGDPRQETTQPPAAMVSPQNSGMLPPRQY